MELITKYQSMSKADLETAIKAADEKAEKAESDFKTFVEALQKSYEAKSKEKDEIVAEIKNSGLGMMKAVAAAKSKDEL